MLNASGKWVGYGLGDVDPKVSDMKAFMRKRFASYCSNLDNSPVFDTTLQADVKEMQSRYKIAVTGILDYATQVKMGYVKTTPPVKPMYFSVEGHMSDMMYGPVADTGRQLSGEGRLNWQPIGYNDGPIPFDNQSGVNELARLVAATVMDNGVPFPAGTPWVLGGFSQGMIVVTDFIVQHLQANADLAWRVKDLKGVLAYGNPCRNKGSVAPWSIAQAGPTANAGMDPKVRLDLLGINPPFPIMDVYRKGDIFSDNEQTVEGQIKSAIYQLIARSDFIGSSYSAVSQIAAAFGKPVDYVWGAFEAIISGISFLASGNNNPHYSPFDISGGVNWVRSLVS